LFWNAGNDYSRPFAAMPVMLANPKTYLKVATQVTATSESAPVASEKPAASGVRQ
jgi:hypothetical protein